MKNNAIWQTFTDTGDPLCYVLYKAMEKMTIQEARSGHRP